MALQGEHRAIFKEIFVYSRYISVYGRDIAQCDGDEEWRKFMEMNRIPVAYYLLFSQGAVDMCMEQPKALALLNSATGQLTFSFAFFLSYLSLQMYS